MQSRAKSEEPENRELMMKESELKSLKRKIRCMGGDRRCYNDDARTTLGRQKDEIQRLIEDNRNTKNLIDFMNSTLMKYKDTKSRTKLQDLAQDIDLGKESIKEENETLRQINFQIHRKDGDKHVQLRVNSKRDKPPVSRLLKRIRVLDNKLEKTQCTFNKQLTTNKDMREQIDHLRHGRTLYAQLHQNLTKELAEMHKDKKRLMQTATDAYSASNDATVRIRGISERCRKDRSQYLSDMKGLQRIIEHHDKTGQFMDVKSYDRSKQLNEVLARRKKLIGDKNYLSEQKTILKYEDAFGVIKEVAGNNDMDQIIKDYLAKEDQNYAMFNYINELNESIDDAKLELADKTLQRDKYREQNGIEDVFRRNVMKNLEVKDKQVSTSMDQYDTRYVELRKKLDELKKPVRVLFNTIGCDPTPMSSMLGYYEEVTDGNLMQYLGIIEDRAIHTLNTHFFTQETIKEKTEKDPILCMVRLKDIPEPPSTTCIAPSIQDPDLTTVATSVGESASVHPLDKLRLVVLVRNRLRALVRRKAKRQRAAKRRARSRQSVSSIGSEKSDTTAVLVEPSGEGATGDEVAEEAVGAEESEIGPAVAESDVPSSEAVREAIEEDQGTEEAEQSRGNSAASN